MQQSVWQLQEAKNRFSQVVGQALTLGAQTVTRHGKPAVVILSVADYEEIATPKKSLFSSLRSCPSDIGGIVPLPSREKAREVKL
ncbi:MAG: type II toxin-antitoxin system Phd/YefM family antitoxin [Luteolibacter sp.]